MLHNVPDSIHRDRLLEVVQLQRQLLDKLCRAPEGQAIDEAWIRGEWEAIQDEEWIRVFWNLDKGERATWCKTIAAAALEEKALIQEIVDEQLRFADLYRDDGNFRLRFQDWSATPVMEATNNLLESFYDPLFYDKIGYPNADGTRFSKVHFIGAPPRVCPYTDTTFQDTKLDHFLPKDRFPMLSCHPDNLIPCSTDSNSGGHKGKNVPLDRDEASQSAAWFHPRWRPAWNSTGHRFKFEFQFREGPPPLQEVILVAATDLEQRRVDNMNKLFGLSEFWGRFLHIEVQQVAADVTSGLRRSPRRDVNTENVRAELEWLICRKRDNIGHEGLAIVTSSFYAHILATPRLFNEVLSSCERDADLPEILQ